jgi:hypothetical protein
MVAWFAVAMWPLQRAAMVPLLGIGFISLGGLVGSYSLARNATWLLIGNKAWEADEGCHRCTSVSVHVFHRPFRLPCPFYI